MRCWFFCPVKTPLLNDSHAMYLPFKAVDSMYPPICLRYAKKVKVSGVTHEISPLRGFLTYGTNDSWIPIGISALISGLYDFVGGRDPKDFYIIEAEIPEDEIIVLDKFAIGLGIQHFDRVNLKDMYFEAYQTGLHAYVAHIEQQDVVGLYQIQEVKEHVFKIQNVYDERGAMPLINCDLYTDGVGNAYTPEDNFDLPNEKLQGLLVQEKGLEIAYSYMSPIQVSHVCNMSVQDEVFKKLDEVGIGEARYNEPLINLLGEGCSDVCVDIIAEDM